MASVTVETVTVLLVGMETNVNSSVTSAHGRASEDACLQMAKAAATEVCLQDSTHTACIKGSHFTISGCINLIKKHILNVRQ